jgi:uncharacterized membrane protein YczE
VTRAPLIRGGIVVRSFALGVGLLLFAQGIVLLLETELGLSPWDVLNQGISERTPLSFGAANVVVGVSVLTLAAALGARIGAGSVANAVGIGVFVDLLSWAEDLDALATQSVVVRLAITGAAIAVIAVGSGLYIGAGLGAGPRDSLMLVGSRRTGVRIGIVRGTIEVAVAAVGLVLGGTVGIGTVAFAFAIGPAVELCFRALVVGGIADVESPDDEGARLRRG